MFPRIIGHRVRKRLGAGGFGAVYLADRLGEGRQVAVKVLHAMGDDARRRFRREAETLARNIRNPCVVDIVCCHLDNDPPYFVMEFCSGGSLRSWVGAGQPWTQVNSALCEAARGLSAIHDRGGFHRDIKPDNLLLGTGPDGRQVVKVADFGLARDPGVAPLTTAGGCGTRGYIAPEILEGGRFTAAADIYSLGITGIELLTGERNVNALVGADAPAFLKQRLARMVQLDPSQRLSIDELLAPPPKKKLAPKRQPSGGGLGAALIGFAVIALAAAAAADKR